MLYETNLKDIFNKVVVIVMKSLYKNCSPRTIDSKILSKNF